MSLKTFVCCMRSRLWSSISVVTSKRNWLLSIRVVMEFTFQTLHKHIIKIHIKQPQVVIYLCDSLMYFQIDFTWSFSPTQRYQAIIALLPNMFNQLRFVTNKTAAWPLRANERKAHSHYAEHWRRYLSIVSPVRWRLWWPYWGVTPITRLHSNMRLSTSSEKTFSNQKGSP